MTLHQLDTVTPSDTTNIFENTNVNPSMSKAETQIVDPKAPLHTYVRAAALQYLNELEEQMPTNLYDTFITEVEKPLIEVVLEKTYGNQSKAAKILGLNRGTLRKKMQQYNIK